MPLKWSTYASDNRVVEQTIIANEVESETPEANWQFPSKWHVSVGAESIAAAMFARCGYDVSVQYGANQPEYDLMVAKGECVLKVSVKGSQDGSWGLCQSHLEKSKANYHEAIDQWVARHKPRTIVCLVQFEGIAESKMPRVYLATPEQIGERLHAQRNGCGDAILHEHHEWKRGKGAGTTEQIPPDWKFSPERIDALMMQV